MLRDILIDNIVSNYLQNLDASSNASIPENSQSPNSIVTPAIRKSVMEKLKKSSSVETPTCVLVFDTETT